MPDFDRESETVNDHQNEQKLEKRKRWRQNEFIMQLHQEYARANEEIPQ